MTDGEERADGFLSCISVGVQEASIKHAHVRFLTGRGDIKRTERNSNAVRLTDLTGSA